MAPPGFEPEAVGMDAPRCVDVTAAKEPYFADMTRRRARFLLMTAVPPAYFLTRDCYYPPLLPPAIFCTATVVAFLPVKLVSLNESFSLILLAPIDYPNCCYGRRLAVSGLRDYCCLIFEAKD